MFCKNCGIELPDNMLYCTICGTAVNGADNVPPEVLRPLQPTHPMKWHKFLIYFQLFLSAIANLANGIAYFVILFSGLTGGTQNVIYFVDGVVSVVVAVLAVYVRFRLAGFRENGPKMYMVLLGILCAMRILGLIYAIITDIYSVAYSAFSLLTYVCITLLTNVYYEKRADLFVN